MSNLEKRALRAGSFVHNNGKVLRTVNILRLKYNKLTGVQSVLEDDGIAEDEFLDSVNFLACGASPTKNRRPWPTRTTRRWRPS